MQQQQIVIKRMEFLTDWLYLQLDNLGLCFMKNVLDQIQPILQLADEIKETENCLTMPITNDTGAVGLKSTIMSYLPA